jgi:hypothetical protein
MPKNTNGPFVRQKFIPPAHFEPCYEYGFTVYFFLKPQ